MVENFSDKVYEYFENRETYPVTVFYKNENVDERFLQSLKEDVERLEDTLVGVEVLSVEVCEGDYWSGVLVEFSGREVPNVDTKGSYDPTQESVSSRMRSIYREYQSGSGSTVGFRTGNSVSSSSALKSLGEDYFSL
jgi:hypothetical protein